MNFWSYENKFIFPGISWMRPFVWHPQTNPFPKTKVDRFNRKKTISKNVRHSRSKIDHAHPRNCLPLIRLPVPLYHSEQRWGRRNYFCYCCYLSPKLVKNVDSTVMYCYSTLVVDTTALTTCSFCCSEHAPPSAAAAWRRRPAWQQVEEQHQWRHAGWR